MRLVYSVRSGGDVVCADVLLLDASLDAGQIRTERFGATC
jgi:hypothetical protein